MIPVIHASISLHLHSRKLLSMSLHLYPQKVIIFTRPFAKIVDVVEQPDKSILEGICFLIRLYEYTKIKSPDSGKITSLPRSQDVKRDPLRASLQSSPKINYMLIRSRIYIQCKSSRFFAVSTVSARNAREPNLPFVS